MYLIKKAFDSVFIYFLLVICRTCFLCRKKRSKTEKTTKEERIEKGDYVPTTRKAFVGRTWTGTYNHLADESQTLWHWTWWDFLSPLKKSNRERLCFMQDVKFPHFWCIWCQCNVVFCLFSFKTFSIFRPGSMVSAMAWSDSANILATIQEGQFVIYYHPSGALVDHDLLPLMKETKLDKWEWLLLLKGLG